MNPNVCPATGVRFRFADGANDALMREIRRRAAPILQDEARLRRSRRLVQAKGAIWAVAFILSYVAMLAASANGWVCVGFAISAGLAALMLAISVGHDAAHSAVFSAPVWNRTAAIGSFALLGVDGNLWQRRHAGSHHAFPNVSGCDVDIDQNPVMRLSPHHARRPWQRWQHVYAPLAYALVQAHSIVVGDAIYLFRKRLANIIRERPARADVAIFVSTKVAYLTLAFAVPAAVLQRPWWQIAVTWFGVSSITSLIFIALLIGTHFVEPATHPAVAADGAINGSWACHQLATSLDWSPESRIANWTSGGANAHAAHHLFPRVPHTLYPALTPAIREAARQQQAPYNQMTFLAMVRSHFRFLRAMSAGAAAAPRNDVH